MMLVTCNAWMDNIHWSQMASSVEKFRLDFHDSKVRVGD